MELGASSRSAHQQGFVLVMTLVILVIVTLSSLAMMGLMKAGVSASGNIAFRQAAVRVADVGVEQAFQWISGRISTSQTALDTSDATQGYYAIHNETAAGCMPSGAASFSAAGYDFANTNCAKPLASQISGYALYYVIHRMASASGACPDVGCMKPPSSATSVTTTPVAGESQDSSDFTTGATTGVSDKTVYYRITVKVVGPRHNNRYVQAFVY